jgi:hypothetical protein
MAKRTAINLDRQLAALKREQSEIEEKQKTTSGITKTELPAAKAVVFEHLAKLADLGVAENYNATLLQIAALRADEGARLPLLRKVLTDQVSLDDARHELGSEKYNVIEDSKSVEKTGAGFLREKTEGNTVTIYITPVGKDAFEKAKN